MKQGRRKPMNKIYRIIWSKAKNCYVVVSEIAKRSGKSSSGLGRKLLVASVLTGALVGSCMGTVYADFQHHNDGDLVGNDTVRATVEDIAWLNSLHTDAGNVGFAKKDASNLNGYEVNWGESIGVGTVTANDKRLVTGGTVYAALQSMGGVHYYSVNADPEEQDNYNNEGATGINAMAAGIQAKAEGPLSVAVGYKAATGTGAASSTAVGVSTTANGPESVAVGYTAVTEAPESAAFGHKVTASGVYSIAVGNDVTVKGTGSMAIGRMITVEGSGNGSTAIGYNSKISESGGGGTYLIGNSTSMEKSDGSFAIGTNQIFKNSQSSYALGKSAYLENSNSSFAIGDQARLENSSASIAIGQLAKVTGYSSSAIAIGQAAEISGQSSASGAFGQYAKVISSTSSMAVGQNAKVENSSASNVFGQQSLVKNSEFAVALGNNVQVLDRSYSSVVVGNGGYGYGNSSKITNSQSSVVIAAAPSTIEGSGVQGGASAFIAGNLSHIKKSSASHIFGTLDTITGGASSYIVGFGNTITDSSASYIIGNNSSVEGGLASMAIGYNSHIIKNANSSIAIGGYVKIDGGAGESASGSAISIGDYSSITQSGGSQAFGKNAHIERSGGSTAVGTDAKVIGGGGNQAFGNGSIVDSSTEGGGGNTAMGSHALVSGIISAHGGNTAVGDTAKVVNSGGSQAFGNRSTINQSHGSTVLGTGSVVTSTSAEEGTRKDNGLAVGSYSTVQDSWAGVAIGQQTIVKDSDSSFAAGTGNKIEWSWQSAVVGHGSTVIGDQSTAIGASSQVYAKESQAFGHNSLIDNSDRSTAIGVGAQVKSTVHEGDGRKNEGLAIGTYTTLTDGWGSTAMGFKTEMKNSDSSVAIGTNNKMDWSYQSVLVGHESEVIGSQSIAIGVGNKVYGSGNAVIGDPNIVHGEHNKILADNVTVGSDSENVNNLVIVGYHEPENSDTFGTESVSLGARAYSDMANGVALGTDSTTGTTLYKTPYIKINGTQYDFAGGDPVATVSVGSEGKERTITNVAAGRISETSTDAINGSQLFAAIKALNEKVIVEAADQSIEVTSEVESSTESATTGSGGNAGNADAAGETGTAGDAGTDGNTGTAGDGGNAGTTAVASATEIVTTLEPTTITTYKVHANTTTAKAGSDNVTVVDNLKSTSDGTIHDYTIDLAKDITVDTVTVNKQINVGGDTTITGDTITTKTVNADTFNAGDTTINNDGLTIKNGPSVTKNGIDAGGKKITNVAPGTDGTDAVNVNQLREANQDIYNSMNRLDNSTRKGIAGAAALAALHPLDFDPDDKWEFSAGVGNYRGETAAAIGAFYHPNDDTIFSLGATVGNGENLVNGGVTFRFGQQNHQSRSKKAMAKEIVELRAEVAELKAMVYSMANGRMPGLDLTKSEEFPDTPENHWAYDYVSVLAGNGVLEGYQDGYFKGDRTLTRYEMAAIIYRAMMKGVDVDERMKEEFAPELARVKVDTLTSHSDGTPSIQRVRVIKGRE